MADQGTGAHCTTCGAPWDDCHERMSMLETALRDVRTLCGPIAYDIADKALFGKQCRQKRDPGLAGRAACKCGELAVGPVGEHHTLTGCCRG